MKMIKLSALVLASGLFFTSCGDGANDETPVDTMQMETPPMDEAMPMPDTVNGIDTTVNTGGRDNSTSMSGGSGNSNNNSTSMTTSTGKSSGSTNMNGGSGNVATSGGDNEIINASGGNPNSVNQSSTGKPTQNPGKAPGTGHPARAPEKDKKNATTPSM